MEYKSVDIFDHYKCIYNVKLNQINLKQKNLFGLLIKIYKTEKMH